MKRVAIWRMFCAAALLGFCSGCASCRDDHLQMTTADAYRIIRDRQSQLPEFDRAMAHLTALIESPAFWNGIANDPDYPASHRRKAVRQVFQQFVPENMTLAAFTNVVGLSPSWISLDRIRDIRDLSGWIPAAVLSGQSRFVMPVLPDGGGEYHLVIFLSLDTTLSLQEFRGILSREMPQRSSSIRIVGCAPWDSIDQERRYPGSAGRWAW